MDTNDKQYLLLIFQFIYGGDLSCLWPVMIDSSPENKSGQNDIDFFNAAIAELKELPGVEKVRIVHQKYAGPKECEETFADILGHQAVDDTIRVKYLKIQERTVKLADDTSVQYQTNKAYSIITTKNRSFPVRIRAYKFPSMLDETELPLVVFTKTEDKELQSGQRKSPDY